MGGPFRSVVKFGKSKLELLPDLIKLLSALDHVVRVDTVRYGHSIYSLTQWGSTQVVEKDLQTDAWAKACAEIGRLEGTFQGRAFSDFAEALLVGPKPRLGPSWVRVLGFRHEIDELGNDAKLDALRRALMARRQAFESAGGSSRCFVREVLPTHGGGVHGATTIFEVVTAYIFTGQEPGWPKANGLPFRPDDFHMGTLPEFVLEL